MISSFRPVIGGAERATENLTHALVGQGTDVIVLTRRYSADQPATEMIKGVPVFRLGVPGRGKWNALTFALHALWVLATRFRRYRLLHVQNIDTPMLVGICARFLLNRRLIATIHGESPLLMRRQSSSGRLRLQLMSRAVGHFTAINPENVEQLIRADVDKDRISVIPNGVDVEHFHPPTADEKQAARQQLQLRDDDRVVLYLGRLVPFKRVDLLLEAWARLERREHDRLLVIGGGSEADNLRRQAQALGIDVRFEGPRDDTALYYQAADIFVLPSGDDREANYEGLSVALIEAMASGLTPIVTDCPGNRVLIQPEETGLLLPMGDAAALAIQVDRALNAPELRRSIGQSARELICSQYSIQQVAALMRSLYQNELTRG